VSLLQICVALFLLCGVGAAIGYRFSPRAHARYRLVAFVARVCGFAVLGLLAAIILPSIPLILMGNAQGPLVGFLAAPFGLIVGGAFGYWWCQKARNVA
jgi:hypothetical protein